MIQQLIQIGFNEEQAKVYLVCLELGKANIARIVRKSGVSKKMSYKALGFLTKEGFITSEGRKKRLFFVTDVERIGEKLQDRLKGFYHVLPQLYSVSNIGSSNRSLITYTDPDTIRNAFKRQMRKEPEGSRFNVIESSWFHFIDWMNAGRGGSAFDIYEQVRINRNIWVNALFVDADKKIRNPLFETHYKRPKREVRTLSSTINNTLAGMYIWHDRVFLFDHKPDGMLMIEISSRDIRQGFSVYFDSLWQIAEVVK